MILVFLILILLVLFHFLSMKPFSYWSERNVKTSKILPVFGNIGGLIFGNETLLDVITKIYMELRNVRYYGLYQFQMPVLVLKAPELIKQICIKDFDHFSDHKNDLPHNGNELWSKTLFVLKGQSWKKMRSILSPSFTSSKMKAMFGYIQQNAQLVTQHLLEMKEDVIKIDLKDTFSRYSNDVIVGTAYGIRVDSLKNRENEFYMIGQDMKNFGTPWRKFVVILNFFFPKIAALSGFSFFGRKLSSFFMSIVKDTIKMREENNIHRSDVLGLLMKARKEKPLEENIKQDTGVNCVPSESDSERHNKKQELSDGDIASQVFIFSLGGFESASNTLCFMAYELALNVDVQMKLIQEIDENLCGDSAVNYEKIQSLTYLDMVVSETLRKWPSSVFTDRIVTKRYTIQPETPEEKPLLLEVGDQVIIPIMALHKDPKYFEDPDKFIPERFSPENRKNINPYVYMPFGVGPRNCIGSKFALILTKAVFCSLLTHFEIVPVEKTNIPLKISKLSFNFASISEVHLGLKRRKKMS